MEILAERKLGARETLYTIMHDEFHGAFTVSAIFGLKGKVNLQKFISALHLLYLRHPLLRAVIHNKKEYYAFELSAAFEDIPIRQIHRENSEHWKSVLESVIDVPLETDRYLWRFCILYSQACDCEFECILNIHHAISDGVSINYLIQDLLNYYERLILDETFSVESKRLMPSLETLLSASGHKPSNKISNIELTEQMDIPYQGFAPIGERRSKNIYINLDKTFYSHLMKQYRQNNVTVTSILNVTFLLSLQKMINQTINTSLLTAVNLRRYFDVSLSNDTLGCYFTNLDIPHKNLSSEARFWPLAQTNLECLNEGVDSAVQSLLATKDLEPKEQWNTIQKLAFPERQSFFKTSFISSKGIIPYQESYGGLQLSFYYDCVSEQAANIAMSSFVTTFHDKIFLTFNYPFPMIQTEWAEEFADYFISILKRNVLE